MATPSDPDPCTWSMSQRRAVRDEAFETRRWVDVVRAHSCIADDTEQDTLYAETDARLEHHSPWSAQERTFTLSDRWARRGAGGSPDEISAALGLSRLLVAHQPGYTRAGLLYDVLQSPHAKALEGISYTPHSRGDEITARLLSWFASAKVTRLRYFRYQGGDLSTEQDFVAFIQSPAAAHLEIAHFGGSEQRLWFRHLATAPMLPRLKALSVSADPRQRAQALSFLRTAPMEHLESLTVHEPDLRRGDHDLASAIGENPHLAGLRVLRLSAHTRFADPGPLVDALLSARHLRQLSLLCVSIHDPEQLQRLRSADRFRSTRVETTAACGDDPYRW